MNVKVVGLAAIVALAMSATAWADDTKKPIDRLLGKCPEGQNYFPNHNECIPEGSITEIDGVSVDEISKVLDAHRDELYAIKGVVSAGIDQHGIAVDVLPDYDKLPDTLDGLPVHTHPYVYEVLIGADMPSF
jgi:hypothetical protein